MSKSTHSVKLQTSSFFLSAGIRLRHQLGCVLSIPSSRSSFVTSALRQIRCTTEDFGWSPYWSQVRLQLPVGHTRLAAVSGERQPADMLHSTRGRWGEPPFMPCSIMWVRGSDGVALKCKYLWNKTVIGSGVDTLCMKLPPTPSA